MRSHISLPIVHSRELPPELREYDVRFSEALVRLFLEEFTRPGDVVFNPFAGCGTTLDVAESMGRVGYGIEYDERKVRYAHSILQHPERMIHGDSRKLASYQLPACDFSMSSPPFMLKDDIEDPLAAYTTIGAGYEAYLEGIRSIYAQLADLMKLNSFAMIEVANLKRDSEVTMLAWDVARVVGEVLNFDREIIACWEQHYYGYDHTYCLLFQKKTRSG